LACARPGSGQQLVEPALGIILYARDDVGEIGEGVDAARFAGRDERVQPGDADPGLDVADEEKVLWPSATRRSERSDALLSSGTRAASRKRPSSSRWFNA